MIYYEKKIIFSWQASYLIRFTRFTCTRRNCYSYVYTHFMLVFIQQLTHWGIRISLKFIPKGLISNILALVQIMVCRRPGDKPLPEPTIILLTHICVTRPQWVWSFNQTKWQSPISQFSFTFQQSINTVCFWFRSIWIAMLFTFVKLIES